MRTIFVSVALLALPAGLAAQLPDPSVRALGMGGAYTAIARGWEAVAWNPGLLAARGRPGFSIGLPSAQADFGSNAWGWGDVRRYDGKHLTDADKQYLLDQVDTTLNTRSAFGVTPFGLQIGPFAFSIGTAGNMRANVGKDAVELILFGNAYRSTPFTLTGSRADGWAATTAGLSYAMNFALPLGRLSAGATIKKVWGHGVATGREITSTLQTNPNFNAQLVGHAVYTDYPDNWDFEGTSIFSGDATPGSGFGLDLGGVLELPGGLTVGAALINIVGTMSWDKARFTYERADYQVTQSPGGQVTDTLIRSELNGAAIDSDPAARALRDSLLDRADFSRVVRAGATLRLAGFRVAADAQLRLSEGLDDVPSQSVSVGAEYVVLGILPLRAGFGTDFSESITLSAGTGLHLGPFKFDLGASNTSGDTRNGVRVGAGIGLIF